MNLAFPPCPSHTHWKALYRAAIFEKDKSLIPGRIAEAERAIRARGREILYGEGLRDERNALDNALHALHALRSAWETTRAA